MALRYVNPLAATNGSGTSWADALNTLVGVTYGAHTYGFGPGTLYETITPTSAVNGGGFVCLDPANLPVIDCENSRAIGFNFNSTVGITLEGFRFVNQNAAPANGGVKLSGSAHTVRNIEFENCQVSIHGTNCPGTVISDITMDVGNVLTLTGAYGIRLINVLSGVAPIVTRISMRTSLQMEYASGIMFENSDRGAISKVRSTMDATCDHIGGRLGASGITVKDSLLVGNGDLISLESAQSWTISNNTIIHQGTLAGHFGPCVKFGDAFGVGLAPDNCVVKNNLLVAYGANGKVLIFNPAGASNTVDGNWMYAPDAATPINYDVGGGLSALTYAQFEALGYQATGGDTDPMLSSGYRPLPGSPLLTGGVDLGYLRDIDGRQCRRFIGAHCAATLRAI